MFDLIGFWSAVTIFTVIFLACPLALIVLVGDWLLSAASRGRVNPLEKVEKYLRDVKGYSSYKASGTMSNYFAASILGGLICSIMTTLLMSKLAAGATVLAAPNTFIEMVSYTAVALTPLTYWIGMVALIGGGSFFLVRKICDVYFSVQDKLTKLAAKQGE